MFERCNSLKEITFSNGIKRLSCSADGGGLVLKSLTTVNLPSGVTTIHPGFFDDCPALTTILVPAGKIDYYKQRLPDELHDKILELKYEK